MAGKCNAWEIWTADIRFEDSDEVKPRPVLVAKIENNVYALCVKITKHPPRTKYEGEYAIKKWREAGLRMQSTIRFSQMYRLSEDDLKTKVGTLHPIDIIASRKILNYISHNIIY